MNWVTLWGLPILSVYRGENNQLVSYYVALSLNLSLLRKLGNDALSTASEDKICDY